MQILVNFLSNALKFSPRDKKVEVELLFKQKTYKIRNELNEDGEIVIDTTGVPMETFVDFDIIVRDFGYGISEEQKSKLFMDFGKLDENSHMNR